MHGGGGATGTLSWVRNVISRGLILLAISPAPVVPVSLLLFPLTHLSVSGSLEGKPSPHFAETSFTIVSLS